ncbi:MAG: glutaredoxin [Agarilytica sp.]
MKNLILIAIIAFGGFQAWKKFGGSLPPMYDEPYIAVYGRDSCGYTNKMLSELQQSGANYHYFVVDDQSIADTLHTRMESSGISTRRYNLPVIDVNGRMSVRPEFQDVISEYNETL